MADFSNLPTGLNTTTQIPLYVKNYVTSEAVLASLGASNFKAFTYEENLNVYCIQEKSTYKWREVQSGEENTGLLPSDYTYPSNVVTFGITYSNKKFNFFRVNETYTVTNVGTGGEGTYVNQTVTESNTQFNFKKIKSNSLTITSDSTSISIETPTIADIPRFIVNSAYTGTDELGTLSKPFKDIPQAITAFLNGGVPAIVLVQKGNGYTYTGHFQYDGLTLELESGAGIGSLPTNGWLCDLDALSPSTKCEVTFVLGEGSVINLLRNGFRNRGTNVNNSAFTTYKRISIRGKGQVIQSVSDDTNPDLWIMFESNFANLAGYYNDSVSPFDVRDVRVNPQSQGVMKMGGFTYSNFLNLEIAVSNPGVSVHPNMIPFRFTGGTVNITGCNIGVLVGGLRLFGFNPSTGVPVLLNLTGNNIGGNLETMFANQHATLKPGLVAYNNYTGGQLNVVNLFTSTPLWDTIYFNYNTISSVTNDFDGIVDLTSGNNISVHNKIGANIIESLRRFANRTAAESVCFTGSKFINTNSNNVSKSTWFVDITMQ